METDSKSSLANPDIKLVTIDVKMQIRTLYAVCKLLDQKCDFGED
jgi:hypothetical protein